MCSPRVGLCNGGVDGGIPCHMLSFRNSHVACLCRKEIPMIPVHIAECLYCANGYMHELGLVCAYILALSTTLYLYRYM